MGHHSYDFELYWDVQCSTYIENSKSTIKTLAVVDCAGKYLAATTMELVRKVTERYNLKKTKYWL